MDIILTECSILLTQTSTLTMVTATFRFTFGCSELDIKTGVDFGLKPLKMARR